MDVKTAIDTLTHSERGTNSLRHFSEMLEDGGRSLDLRNWKALETLCSSMRTDDGYSEVIRRLRERFPKD